MKSRIIFLVLIITACMFVSSTSIFAEGMQEEEGFPSKPITYIIPFNPGGQSDITAQYQKEDLQKVLGENIIIKHMPGAGGAVAWASLVK